MMNEEPSPSFVTQHGSNRYFEHYVAGCGQGFLGQLGMGEDMFEVSAPDIIKGLPPNIVKVECGGMHSLCLSANGHVYTFGCNDEGALGRFTITEYDSFVPQAVNLPDQVAQISAGETHSAVILNSGQVMAWGTFKDSEGNLGLNFSGGQNMPVPIMPHIKFTKISSGLNHLVMLSTDGKVYTVGCSEQGQLGRIMERKASRKVRFGLENMLRPRPIWTASGRFSSVWTGTHCTFVKNKFNLEISACGLNNFNQLGILNPDECTFFLSKCPKFCGMDWLEVSGGKHHTLARNLFGQCFVLGRKECGRLGLGDTDGDAENLTIVPALQGEDCTSVKAGEAVSFAVTRMGKAYSWGMGTNLQLGTGDEENVYEPTLINTGELKNSVVKQVSVGGQHTLFLIEKEHANQMK